MTFIYDEVLFVRCWQEDGAKAELLKGREATVAAHDRDERYFIVA